MIELSRVVPRPEYQPSPKPLELGNHHRIVTTNGNRTPPLEYLGGIGTEVGARGLLTTVAQKVYVTLR